MELCDINQIKALLDRHGFRFSKSMGQNFLVAPWVPEQIAAMAGLDENTGVLEVGPGIGCLTAQLARSAGRVVSVELDKALRPVLAETLAGLDNAEIVFGDVLKLNIPELVAEKHTFFCSFADGIIHVFGIPDNYHFCLFLLCKLGSFFKAAIEIFFKNNRQR